MAQASSGVAKNDVKTQGDLVSDSAGRVKPGPGHDPLDPSHGMGTNVEYMPVDALPPPTGDGEHRLVSSRDPDGVRDEVWVYSGADNVWIPEKDWDARQAGDNHNGSPGVDVPVEFKPGDTRVDYNGNKLIYMNGRWVDYYAFMEGMQPSDTHNPTPDPWIPRNPEEIDLNPSSVISSVDANPVGGVFGYNYLGPYTTVSRNIAAGVPPVNELDSLALKHDLAYQWIADAFHSGRIRTYSEAQRYVRAADRELIRGARRLWWSQPAQFTAIGMSLKMFYDNMRGYSTFVGLDRPVSPRGYTSFGAGSPEPFVHRAVSRLRSVDNAYVRGFRVPRGYDDDRDRNYMPDVMQAYLPLRRRRFYNW